MSEQTKTLPQYKVEYLDHDSWCHRVWRNNEHTAKTICDVESKSRKRFMRVIHQGITIHEAKPPEVSDGKTVRKNNQRNGAV